jgi:Spy/CpxP family protein refolding chaperone
MKKFFIVATLIICFGLTLSCFAQDRPEKQEVKTIFSYKKELGLTDKQAEDMKAYLVKLQNFLSEKGNELNSVRQELGKLLADRADLKLIRKKLEKINILRVDIAYSDIETARDIENVLTPGQLKKWKVLQQQAFDKAKAGAEALKKETPKK